MSALAVVALAVLGGCALAVLLGGPWLVVACLVALFLAKPGPALGVAAVVVAAYLLARR